MDRIETTQTLHRTSVEGLVHGVIRARRLILTPPTETAPAPAVVQAQINHGRWLAHCPFCAGAEMVDPDDPRFCCLSCYNAAVGGKWLPVKFPRDAAKLEAELLRRPQRENRNWLPSETLAQIRAENKARGVS